MIAASTLTDEIIRRGLAAAAEEASIVVVKAAYSAFVHEGADASAVVLDADGRLVAHSLATTLLHTSSLRSSLTSVLAVFPAHAMAEGDVYATNDVYAGGIHANDVLLFRPVHVDGVVRWFTGALVHIADLGGSAAGGVTSLATEIWHEGLQLPPVRMATADGPDPQLLRILAANSRLPDTTVGDVRALLAGVNVGARRVLELVDEHGLGAVQHAVDEHIAHTERRMRQELAAFPDGTYRARHRLDDDGIHAGQSHTVEVAVTIDGDRAVIDFAGTDPQVPASINAGRSQTESGALFALRCFLDPEIPMTEGCFAPVELRIPEGSLLHCTPPYPGGGRFLAVFAAVEAIFQALSAAAPHRAVAESGLLQPFALSGRRADGRPWIHAAYELGGMGARAGRDGIDSIGVHHGGGRNSIPQCEPIETQFPLLVERVELIADSGGPGQWRGGLGTRTVFRLLEGATATHRCDRMRFAPAGRDGAGPGRAGGYHRVGADGQWTALASKSTGVALTAGDRYVLETSGGGGMGNPLARDVAAVAADVASGRVSVDGARRDYGVVVDQAGAVDLIRTTDERSARTPGGPEAPQTGPDAQSGLATAGS